MAGPQLRARVDDDDMALFKVLHECMEILEVETTARVVAALRGNGNRSLSNDERRRKTGGKETHELVFTLHSGKRVHHDGASVRLYGGRYLSCIPDVGGTMKGKEEEQRVRERG